LKFSYKDIIDFFEELGVALYTERKTDIGKVFPTTDQAKTITSLLEDELYRMGIRIYLNTEVFEVGKDEEFQINCRDISQENHNPVKEINFRSKYLVISAGGKTYPALGSNGSGYDLSEEFGHSIVTPVPSALPLTAKDPLIHELQGVKLEAEVTSIIDGVEIKKSIDDLMFTQYGLSGPSILNISREISIHINRHNKSNVKVKINFFPNQKKEEVLNFLKKRWAKRPTQSLEKSLYGIFPNKIPIVILRVIGIDSSKEVKNLSSEEIDRLVDGLSSYYINITRTRGWNEAEFTAGGVNTKDIKIGTLESRLVSKLYFCGEILDVDGDVGGFNLSWAWSSGYVSGKLS